MIERIVLLCNPENRRAQFFKDACARLRLPSPTIIAHADWLAGRCVIDQVLGPQTLLRIESPGESVETQHLLLERGASHADATCTPDESRVWQPEHGQILHGAQRFYGWRDALLELHDSITHTSTHVMTSPLEIIDMFDKHHTYNRLSQHDILTPGRLPPPTSYDHMRAVMREHGCARVFLKPRFGSSASGVVAIQSSSRHIRATTSAQIVKASPRIKLFNTLRIQQHKHESEVAALVNELTQEPMVLERWVPKASIREQSMDLRIVVSHGEAAHVLGRRSASPMTNLHLGNARVMLPELLDVFGADAIQRARELAARAMREAFPLSGYAGLDVMLTAGSLTPRIIEVNAFGDLLPNLLIDGEDTYTHVLRRTIKALHAHPTLSTS